MKVMELSKEYKGLQRRQGGGERGTWDTTLVSKYFILSLSFLNFKIMPLTFKLILKMY